MEINLELSRIAELLNISKESGVEIDELINAAIEHFILIHRLPTHYQNRILKMFEDNNKQMAKDRRKSLNQTN